jgi:hypothetical protein
VIEDIERLDAQPQSGPFFDRDLLIQGRIEIPKRRLPQDCDTGIPERADGSQANADVLKLL